MFFPARSKTPPNLFGCEPNGAQQSFSSSVKTAEGNTVTSAVAFALAKATLYAFAYREFKEKA